MDIKKFMPSLSSNMAQSVDYFIIKTPSSSHKTDLQHHKFDAPHLFDALGGRPLRPALNAALRNSCPDLHENDTCQQFIFLDVKEAINGDAPENNPRHTTVYVGNLATKVRIFGHLVTQLELHHHFHYFGAG